MPTYTITAPDGNTYSIDGPAGASKDDVRAAVLRKNPGAGMKAAAAPPPAAADAPPAAPAYNTAQGLTEDFGHGASMGLADNVGGFVDAMLAPTSRGIMADARENIAARKGDRAAFDTAHPVASKVADAAGSIAGVMGTAGAGGGMLALKAGHPAMNLLKMGVNAMPYGAIQGAADADQGNGLMGGLMGAGTAAIAAPAFGALGMLAGKAGRSLFTGPTALLNYAKGAVPNQSAIGPLLDALQSSGSNPAELRAAIQAAPAGAPESIATAAQPGGAVQQLGKRAILQAGPGKDIGRAAIEDSVSGMLPDVQGKLSAMSGLPVQDTGAAVDALAAARSKASKAAYDAIPTTPIDNADLSATLESNPVYRSAHDSFVDSHNATHPLDQQVGALFGEDGKLARPPTAQDVDAIKRNLGDRLGQMTIQRKMGNLPSGGGDTLTGLGSAQSRLMGLMDANDGAIAPEFKFARDQHAAATDVIKGMEAGREAGMVGKNADPYSTTQEMADFTKPGQDAYKMGALASINNRLRTAQVQSKVANLPAEVVGHGLEGNKNQDMLHAVYDGQDGSNTEAVGHFINQMTTLRKRFDVKNLVSRDGSFENMANGLDQAPGLARAVGHGGPVRAAWHLFGNVADSIAGRYNRSANKAIASEVFTPRAGDQADGFMKMLDDVYAARQKSQARLPSLSRLSTAAGLATIDGLE